MEVAVVEHDLCVVLLRLHAVDGTALHAVDATSPAHTIDATARLHAADAAIEDESVKCFQVAHGEATAIGTPPTREVTAGRKLTNQTLAGVTTIRVEGLRNAMTSRR